MASLGLKELGPCLIEPDHGLIEPDQGLRAPDRFDRDGPLFDRTRSMFHRARPKFDRVRPGFDRPRSRFEKARPRFNRAKPKFLIEPGLDVIAGCWLRLQRASSWGRPQLHRVRLRWYWARLRFHRVRFHRVRSRLLRVRSWFHRVRLRWHWVMLRLHRVRPWFHRVRLRWHWARLKCHRVRSWLHRVRLRWHWARLRFHRVRPRLPLYKAATEQLLFFMICHVSESVQHACSLRGEFIYSIWFLQAVALFSTYKISKIGRFWCNFNYFNFCFEVRARFGLCKLLLAVDNGQEWYLFCMFSQPWQLHQGNPLKLIQTAASHLVWILVLEWNQKSAVTGSLLVAMTGEFHWWG